MIGTLPIVVVLWQFMNPDIALSKRSYTQTVSERREN
jgi:hypothetical protein